MYERALELYIELFNAVGNNAALLTPSSKMIARQVMALLLEMFDKLMEAYEFTAHSTR